MLIEEPTQTTGCQSQNRRKTPQIIHFNRVWNHYKPSILGSFTPIFGNTHFELKTTSLLLNVVDEVSRSQPLLAIGDRRSTPSPPKKKKQLAPECRNCFWGGEIEWTSWKDMLHGGCLRGSFQVVSRLVRCWTVPSGPPVPKDLVFGFSFFP